MDIEKLSKSAESSRPTGIARVSQARTGQTRKRSAAKDSVDMSLVGKTIARGIKDLSNATRVRKAKVQEFKRMAKDTLDLSDEAIDSILHRASDAPE